MYEFRVASHRGNSVQESIHHAALVRARLTAQLHNPSTPFATGLASCIPPYLAALTVPPPAFPFPPTTSFWFLKERVAENIQKRDSPAFGPSLRNSWPRLLPHLPQETRRADGDSVTFLTLSGWTVWEKAGQGEECLNFLVLKKSSLPHWAQRYNPTAQGEGDQNTHIY